MKSAVISSVTIILRNILECHFLSIPFYSFLPSFFFLSFIFLLLSFSLSMFLSLSFSVSFLFLSWLSVLLYFGDYKTMHNTTDNKWQTVGYNNQSPSSCMFSSRRRESNKSGCLGRGDLLLCLGCHPSFAQPPYFRRLRKNSTKEGERGWEDKKIKIKGKKEGKKGKKGINE